MSANKIIYAVIGLIIGSALGFFFANAVNRDELDSLRAELTRARNASAAQPNAASTNPNDPPQPPESLSPEQLRTVITKADAAPNDTGMQQKVGQGLYLYAVRFNQLELLPEAVRILRRAHEADEKNYETTVALGNALFDLGQRADPSKLAEARAYYAQALEMKPNDVNVRTDLGLTYYFGQPSDPQRAIREYRKSLAVEPRHEMTLQNLTAALIATSQLTEAQQRIAELEKVNAENPALANLRAQLAQSQNAAKEQN